MTDNTQPEALRLAELLELAPEDGIEPQTSEDAAAELRLQHARIAELEARIKTMAEEHADELMVAHLDGRMRAAKVMPESIRSILVRCRNFIDTTKVPAYPAGADLADEIDVLLAAQPAGAQQPGVATWTPLPGTLPEPGKPVLLDIGMEYPIRAMWAAKHTLEVGMEDDSEFGEYDDATDTYYCPEGWYEWNEHEEIHWAVDKTPVAWCELPSTTSAGSVKGE